MELTAHAYDNDLELYVRGRLEPERISAIESHLLVCHSCRERLSRCIGSQLILHPVGKTKPKEKYERSEPRFNTGDDAIFQELNPLSMDRQTVKIVDISKNGLGILAPKSVMVGTIVQGPNKGRRRDWRSAALLGARKRGISNRPAAAR